MNRSTTYGDCGDLVANFVVQVEVSQADFWTIMRSNRPNKRSSIPPITGIGGTEGRTAGKLPTGSLHPSKTPAGGQQNHGGRQAIGTSGIRGVRMGTIPGRTSERTSTNHSENAHQEEAHSPAHQECPSNPVRSPPLSSMMGFTMTSRDISVSIFR